MKSISEASTRVNHGVYADCGNWPIDVARWRRGIPAQLPAAAAGSHRGMGGGGYPGPPGYGGG